MKDPQPNLLSQNLENFLKGIGKVALALSGGVDSLALLHLLKEWSLKTGDFVKAYHVDHGLRPESSEEAEKVKTWAKDMGVPIKVLFWRHRGVNSRIQEKAREARYRLLIEACREDGIKALLTAHHREDNLETFFMRLSRGSGLKGLSGIKEISSVSGIKVIRPLLKFSKTELLHVLGDRPFIEDPSNTEEKFERVRWRKSLQHLQEEGLLDFSRVDSSIQKLKESEEFLSHLIEAAIKNSVILHEEGYVSIPLDFFRKYPRFFARRALEIILREMGHRGYPPSDKALDSFLCRLNPSYKGTFSVCYINMEEGYAAFYRLPSAVSDPMPITRSDFNWDARFLIEDLPSELCGGEYRIGSGTVFLSEIPAGELRDRVSKIKFLARQVLPVIYRGDKVVAVYCGTGSFFSSEGMSFGKVTLDIGSSRHWSKNGKQPK